MYVYMHVCIYKHVCISVYILYMYRPTCMNVRVCIYQSTKNFIAPFQDVHTDTPPDTHKYTHPSDIFVACCRQWLIFLKGASLHANE
jgi:hypothetical protein